MRARVMVIGAGPAGLASAYYLRQSGIPYRIIDRAPVVASTWASLYPSLRLNTAGFVSHLPGRRMPLRFGIYPKGSDYYAYLKAYAEREGFAIEYGVSALHVQPTPDGGWHVETDRDSADYDAVILASGRFGKPYEPVIPGRERFPGQVLHASAFRDPADFAGMRVVVVGNGPSGADIALALKTTAALPILLAIRSDIVLARAYPYGLPTTAWVIVSRWLPKRWRAPFLNRVNYQKVPGVEALGLPLAPNRDQRVGTSAPVRGRDFPEAIRAGAIVPTRGLARFNETSVTFDDGRSADADAVILCTGYLPADDYVHIDAPRDHEGWFQREDAASQQVIGHPGLYLVGRFYRGLGALYNCRVEARAAVRAITDRVAQRGLQPQRGA